MVEIKDSDQLAAGLAEISAGGSGDDLSIAIACWSPSAQQASDRQDTLLVPEISNGTHGRRRVAPILTLAAAGAAAIAAATWLVRSQGWSGASPQQAPPPPFNPLPAIQREAERLCRDPGLIAGTLSQRRQQFSQLRSVPSHSHELLAMADQDPLGALIAWSQPSLPPPGEAEIWQGAIQPAQREEPHPVPGSCPALDEALAAQWHTQARPAPPLGACRTFPQAQPPLFPLPVGSSVRCYQPRA
jgi:hypothetical protein